MLNIHFQTALIPYIMSFSEISKLRKSGRLNEAYQMALVEIDQQPDDIWSQRAMAWVLYDFAKKNATFDSQDKFIKCIARIGDMNFAAEETMFWDSVTWLIRSMMATVERNRSHQPAFFSSLFAAMRPLPLPKPAEAYSALLQTTLRLKTEWQQYPDFCQWWGLDNLRPEDYKPRQTEDGKRILSLAERVFMAYTKALLLQNRQSSLIEWEPQLSKLANDNPSYTYLPYYLARTRLTLGRTGQVMQSMKAFVRKKKGDFWVWELMGDASSDSDEQFCHYAKAMTCRAKDEMLVAMREKMVYQLLVRKQYSEARHELDHVMATRQRHQWSIPYKLQQLTAEPWYLQSPSSTDNSHFYKPFAEKAEHLVFGAIPDDAMTISGILKKSKSGFGFVKDVFIPSWLIENISDGTTISVKAVKSFDKKKRQWGWKAIKIK